MDEHFIKIHKWLYPASWLYGAVVMMRNKLFDWEVSSLGFSLFRYRASL